MNKLILRLTVLMMCGFLYSQCNSWEVEIWESCYPIETTTILQNSPNTSGEFPVEICELVNLEVLNLNVMFGDTNYITGQIPECIGNLENLTYLNLGWNEIYGNTREHWESCKLNFF